MSNVFEYITTENIRWDQLAYKAYGVLSVIVNGVKKPSFQVIIEANPNVPIYDRLPSGIVLFIPVLETNTAKTDAELLPPWKR